MREFKKLWKIKKLHIGLKLKTKKPSMLLRRCLLEHSHMWEFRLRIGVLKSCLNDRPFIVIPGYEYSKTIKKTFSNCYFNRFEIFQNGYLYEAFLNVSNVVNRKSFANVKSFAKQNAYKLTALTQCHGAFQSMLDCQNSPNLKMTFTFSILF